MPRNQKVPTNLENRHGAKKPRALAIPSLYSDWLEKKKGKKDPGVHLSPGPPGNVTGVSPAPSSARITATCMVLLLPDGSVENEEWTPESLEPEGFHSFWRCGRVRVQDQKPCQDTFNCWSITLPTCEEARERVQRKGLAGHAFPRARSL